ncbi:MAG: DHHW family protein [Clostridium sp.]|uniref:DHHW family protein n=1 Tax=Clostridium sp. TaxID=1506 RepID=UPI003216B339
MRNNRKIMVKPTTSFIITFMTIILIITALYVGMFGANIKVEMLVRTESGNGFTLFYTDKKVPIYNDEMAVKVVNSKSNEFNNIKFTIPGREIEGLKIHFGYETQTVQVKNLIVKTPFKRFVMLPTDIKSIFTEVSPDIEALTIDDEVLTMKPKSADAYVYSDEMGRFIKESRVNLIPPILIFILAIILTKGLLSIYNYLVVKGIKPRDFSLVALFIFVLYAPTLFTISGISDGENTEKGGASYVSDKNAGTLNTLIRKVESAYDNNFGLRNLLIRLNSSMNLDLFNIPSTDKVVLGEEGWLYYGIDEGRNVTDQFRGITKFTDEELAKIKTNLEEKKRFLESKGTPFILMITPDKESIYPEYYNKEYKIVSEETRLDQLVEYLDKNSDIHVIDLREELISKKSEELLYYVTDSHWNEYGAYYGYKVLIEEIGKYIPIVEPKKLDEFDIVKDYREIGGGDLANMLSLPKRYPEEHILLKPKVIRTSKPFVDYNYELIRGAVMKNEDNTLPRLLMFRDSFTVALGPFISEHFSETVYQWDQYFDIDLVNEVNPDIIVQQIVERNIGKLLMDNPQEIKESQLK